MSVEHQEALWERTEALSKCCWFAGRYLTAEDEVEFKAIPDPEKCRDCPLVRHV